MSQGVPEGPIALSSSAKIRVQVAARKPPVSDVLVSCGAPELEMANVRLPLCNDRPRLTSDHSPVIVLSPLMVPRKTFVKSRPRCQTLDIVSPLSRLIPAHTRTLSTCFM